MENKFCLEINIPSDYIAPQFMCFPLVAVRADPDARNWYYQNYMMPVARLDGINSLTCEISDAITYGAGGNTYNKVIQLSSMNRTICSQFRDIVSVLQGSIAKKYYCALFMDFYYLSCAEVYYGKHHFIHEVLFYGYDNIAENFPVMAILNIYTAYFHCLTGKSGRPLKEHWNILNAGGKLSGQLHKKAAGYAEQNGIRFYAMYGQTEATARIAWLPWQWAARKCGSIGQAVPGGRLTLEDESGQEIRKPRTEGELVYYGANVSMGYAEGWKDLEKGDEWQGRLCTGDLGVSVEV